MTTMNISLPDQMKSWIEGQVQTGRYSNVSDYMRNLIRQEQDRGDRIAAMQHLVDEARSSGVSDESMADIRARVLERIKQAG